MEKRFHKLDLDRSGSISIGEFVSVPELKENPLVKRVVEIFDSDLDGEVDFKGNYSFKMCLTVKLGDKELFDKEKIGVKEPFLVTKYQITS